MFKIKPPKKSIFDQRKFEWVEAMVYFLLRHCDLIPNFLGAYSHWNNSYIPHWNETEDMKWPHIQHQPPYDISSSYYPVLETYSSRSPEVMENHMQQLRSAGVGREAHFQDLS